MGGTRCSSLGKVGPTVSIYYTSDNLDRVDQISPNSGVLNEERKSYVHHKKSSTLQGQSSMCHWFESLLLTSCALKIAMTRALVTPARRRKNVSSPVQRFPPHQEQMENSHFLSIFKLSYVETKSVYGSTLNILIHCFPPVNRCKHIYLISIRVFNRPKEKHSPSYKTMNLLAATLKYHSVNISLRLNSHPKRSASSSKIHM